MFATHAAYLEHLAGPRHPERPERLQAVLIKVAAFGLAPRALGRSLRELEPALRAHHEGGRPILGTCAGMIVCDAEHLGFLDGTQNRFVPGFVAAALGDAGAEYVAGG